MKSKRALLLILPILTTVPFFQNCSQGIQVSDEAINASIGLNTTDSGNQNQQPGNGNPPAAELPPAPIDPFTPGSGVVLLPIEGEWASIAFEDNIAHQNAGDRDYNDAVFNYRIAEQYNSLAQKVRIFIEVRLREKLSASNHFLSLSVDGDPSAFYENIKFKSQAAYHGSAEIKVILNNDVVRVIGNKNEKLINIFSSTTDRIGEVIRIEIKLDQPELNQQTNIHNVDYKKYRFILANLGESKKGIDIAEINSSDEMLSNGNGYPFGFMIPTDWQPPFENQLIDSAYPRFVDYRRWLNAPNSETPSPSVLMWYLD